MAVENLRFHLDSWLSWLCKLGVPLASRVGKHTLSRGVMMVGLIKFIIN